MSLLQQLYVNKNCTEITAHLGKDTYNIIKIVYFSDLEMLFTFLILISIGSCLKEKCRTDDNMCQSVTLASRQYFHCVTPISASSLTSLVTHFTPISVYIHHVILALKSLYYTALIYQFASLCVSSIFYINVWVATDEGHTYEAMYVRSYKSPRYPGGCSSIR